MKSSIKLTLWGLLTITAIFYACKKEVSADASSVNVNKPHTVKVYLTDDQTPVFDSVFIDLQGLQIKLDDDTLPGDGWISLDIRPGVYNILRFRNGLDTLFATGTLPNAKIKKVRLILGDNNSVMKDAKSFPLQLHGDDREVDVDLENNSFEIVPPGQVLFWIDFDAGRSIQFDNSGPGNHNRFRLRSHIRIFTKRHTGIIEGRVLPADADARVMAINGTDTITAIPEDDKGEFKIVGLKPGIYDVLFDGQNNYRDTTITGVMVRSNEDTHLPTVILVP
jgi:hypothetical protein